MARKLKIMENEKHPLDDLKNDEITEKRAAGSMPARVVWAVSKQKLTYSGSVWAAK